MSIKTLKRLANDLLNNNEEFKVGDIVVWKEGLKNKRTEGPFIITKVLHQPIVDKELDSGSPYFMEPLNVKAGFIDKGNELLEFF